jgi:hypothetical protein
MLTPSRVDSPETVLEPKLPRRDWLVLPMLSLFSICLLIACAELIARSLLDFSRFSGRDFPDCVAFKGPSAGFHGVPNSVCWEKSDEFPLVEYRFNSCGHYSRMECGPKPAGTYKIVIVGSSAVMGLGVQQEQTLPALLPKDLEQRTGRKVEVYNEALPGAGGTPHSVTLHFSEALSGEPDSILWILVPADISRISEILPAPEPPRLPGIFGQTRFRIQEALTRMPLRDAIPHILDILRELFSNSHPGIMLRHYLYESQSLYLSAYLRTGEAGFLKADPGAEWRERLLELDKYDAYMEERAREAGVPMVVSFLPNHAQAAMVSMGNWPPGYDPYRLDNELRAMVTRHGGIYVDALPEFRSFANPEQYFYPVDGHPNAAGHAVFAQVLAKELTSGSVPELKTGTPSQPMLDQSR